MWQEGRTALTAALRSAGIQVEPLSAADLRGGRLRTLQAVVLGGGWAADIRDDLGPAGVTALREFVLRGGGCVGICAGAYLVTDDVRWEGRWYKYPVNLLDGEALGPLPQIAPWPKRAPVTVARERGDHPLQGGGAARVLYTGGAEFRPRDPATVAPLLRYPDGGIASLAVRFGLGRVVVLGVHLEMPAAKGADPRANWPLLGEVVAWAATPDLEIR